MNWFERHLNWTLFLSWIASYPLAFIFTFTFGLIFQPSTDSGWDTITGIVWILSIVFLLYVAAWTSRKKGRSGAWCLLLFVPFGFLWLLFLENKTGISAAEDMKEYLNYQPEECPYCNSNNINNFVIKKAENDTDKERLGYSYLMEGMCYKCNKHWKYVDKEERNAEWRLLE